MHRCATCLRSCRESRLNQGFYTIGIRLQSTATTLSSTSNNRPVKDSQDIWKKGLDLEEKRKSKDDQDVFVNDLSATLEAHRARNRASVIRKVEASPSQLIKRPLFEAATGDAESPPVMRDGIDTEDSSPSTSTLGLGQTSRLTVTNEGWRTTTKCKVKGSPTQVIQRSESEGVQRWPTDSIQAQKRVRKRSRRSYTSSDDVLEYIGGYLHPDKQWKNTGNRPHELLRPWLLYMDASSGTYADRLSTEIKAFESYMKVTPGEGNAFQLAISAVTSVLQSHLPQSSLTLLGSRSTGLATPMSDLDFSIAGLSFAKDQEDSQRPLSPRHLARVGERSLRIVEKYLRFSATFSKPEFVHARVPLVTSRHLATGLDIQIQTLTPYQSALDYVHSYLAELPSLRPLYIILRHSMEIRNLTTVYDGGLGSYTILMMIVTALKHSSGKFAADDLGGQLLHVLEFYANADLYKHGFSANPPRVFEKVNEAKPVEEREARLLDPQLSGIDHILQRRNIRKPYLLALQDPANDLNDLGKNAYAIKHVQATFKFAHERISNAVQSKSFNSDSAEKGISWSCLDYLVKADYKTFEIARSKLQCCNDEVKKGSDEFKSTEVIRQVLLDRANDAMRINEVEQYGANLARQTPPITPHQRFAAQASFWKVNGTSTSIPPERAGQRENPKAKRRIDSTAHKKAQKENITFKSIILASDTRTDESTHSKVPLDILNEWAPSTDEESKSQDQGF